jgi:FtsH-binding integral membrane protein
MTNPTLPLSATTAVRTGAERATLVRRTYALVFATVVVTMIGAAFGLSQPALMAAVARHPIIAFLCTLAPLWLAMSAPRAFPRNILLTFLFTFAEGVWLSPILFIYGRTQPGVIGQAALLTLSTFGVLTLYATFSRRDFSAWGSFFMVGLWVLIGTALLNLFFQNAAASLWISAGALLVFSGLLVFDTWRLRNVFGPDDYVAAAVQIYLDLINIFVALLNLLGGRRN